MATEFGHKISPDKGTKILRTVTEALLPGEEVHLLCKGLCNQPLANLIVVSNFRVIAWAPNGFAGDFSYLEPLSLTPGPGSKSLEVAVGARRALFRAVAPEDLDLISRTVAAARGHFDPEQFADSDAAEQLASAQAERTDIQRAKGRHWPNTQLIGGRLSSKAGKSIQRLCHGDQDPWLILVSSGGAGLLAAWDDRLAIVKTGALTSFMAGSLGGERAATFHYRDITGIEYNSGLLNGVLEILTPSYSGTANRDFWRGSTKSRNADANDPWTLSNTLPLAKPDYKAALPQLNELRRRISEAKQPVTPMTPPAVQAAAASGDGAASGLAEELRRLADLHQAGVLTDEEFAAAKQRLLS